MENEDSEEYESNNISVNRRKLNFANRIRLQQQHKQLQDHNGFNHDEELVDDDDEGGENGKRLAQKVIFFGKSHVQVMTLTFFNRK